MYTMLIVCLYRVPQCSTILVPGFKGNTTIHNFTFAPLLNTAKHTCISQNNLVKKGQNVT